MKSTITFFPVDNGDMTLIKLSDKTTILIDINLRESAEDDENPAFDAVKGLRDRLEKDSGRPFVDAFLLTHPDQDHCRGLQKRFHLGPLSSYNFDPPEGEELKIVMREIWSSPMIFRRASKNSNPLCEDAKAFNAEARRRVKVFRDKGFCSDGDRILVIGEDEEGKTEGLEPILVKLDEVFNLINGKRNDFISMHVLGPFPIQDDSEEEERLKKNHSSVILRYTFVADGQDDACLFLSGGDAGVYIWERMWKRKKSGTSDVQYDLLLTPHHCSWHSLSYDSWSKDENPQVSQDAKSALSQARDGGFIVSSSKPIKNDKSDPPCWGAKVEYQSILDSVDGEFFCTGEHPNEEAPESLTFTISKEGPQPPSKKSVSITGPAIGAGSTKEPRYHG
ncbi:MAG: metallohydrolase [Deltaproteobacteria bacterium]|nr:metallohydrolase [Deltaproteobacteria bacterium]